MGVRKWVSQGSIHSLLSGLSTSSAVKTAGFLMPSLTLLLALVALAATFASLATVCWLRCAKVSRTVTETAARLSSSLSKIEANASEIAALGDSLELLRGKFYAARRTSQPTTSSSGSGEGATDAGTVPPLPSDPAGKLAWKRTMRAQLGLTPTVRK